MGLLEILRRPATTAADLRKMLGELDQPAAEAAVAEAEAARRDALLGGTDAAVDRAEKALAAAKRELDRLVAAKAELERRIPALEIAERDAALAAERAEIDAEANAVAAAFKAKWPGIVSEAVGLLERLEKVERRAERFNEHLAHTFGVDTPVPRFSYPMEMRLGLHGDEWHQHSGIRKNTRIMPLPDGSPGWNY